MHCHCCCLCRWRQADKGACQRCLTEATEVVEATNATEVTVAETVFPLPLSLSVSVEAG